MSAQKSDSEETDGPKPHIKLRRAVSENPRPASTPPTIASADKEDREEDRIAAELEVSADGAARSHLVRVRAIRCSTTRKNCTFYSSLCAPLFPLIAFMLQRCRSAAGSRRTRSPPLPHVQAAGAICRPGPRRWGRGRVEGGGWAEPEITRRSLTHIITLGSQITARQMDPDDAATPVCATLFSPSPRKNKI